MKINFIGRVIDQIETKLGKAIALCTVADERKARDIVALDVSPLTTIADTFIICTCENSIHIRTLMNEIELKAKNELGCHLRREGTPETNWVVLSDKDIVCHLMDQGLREYYDLEGIWHEAPNLPWEIKEEHPKQSAVK